MRRKTGILRDNLLILLLVPGRRLELLLHFWKRVLSPNPGMLQQAARQRTDSHKGHRMNVLRASSILQDVAVNGSNVSGEHAPEHALKH
jgi:hypothetical protein